MIILLSRFHWPSSKPESQRCIDVRQVRSWRTWHPPEHFDSIGARGRFQCKAHRFTWLRARCVFSIVCCVIPAES